MKSFIIPRFSKNLIYSLNKLFFLFIGVLLFTSSYDAHGQIFIRRDECKVECRGITTAVVDVLNPSTGRIWMDRNLGANRAPINSTDAQAYGSLYQWGRGSDGHQCVNRYTGDASTSGTTTTLSSTDQPCHSDFIINNITPSDWRNPSNANLWQGVNGINNPCPSGYRLPTETELNAEISSWSAPNATGAYGSNLKLQMAGARIHSTGSLASVNIEGLYWSSTVNGNDSKNLIFTSTYAYVFPVNKRAFGFSVRCIKN